MNEFDDMENCMKEIKELLDQLKRRPLKCGYNELVTRYTEEERAKLVEKFWDSLMETNWFVDDLISKGGFHDNKS